MNKPLVAGVILDDVHRVPVPMPPVATEGDSNDPETVLPGLPRPCFLPTR